MRKTVLCILDGIGINKQKKGNAFALANTPFIDSLLKEYPNSKLEASGIKVGLPKGQIGNSEVGHSTIGAGRIISQPLVEINKSIKDKSFYKNKELLNVMSHTKNNKSKLHIFGLLSDGGVHSTTKHLYELLKMCKSNKVEQAYLHLFLDGRDTSRLAGIKYIKQLEKVLEKYKFAKIATISGRFYSMDRDNRWDRIKQSYETIVEGKNLVKDYKKHINNSYENGVYDEFITPITVESNGIVEDNDGLIVFNFRPDRLRELFKVITRIDFDDFENKNIFNLQTVTMFPVSDEVVCKNAFEHDHLDNTLGEYTSKLGLKQLRIAETEKYAHVTYFFDGGKNLKLDGKKQILIPSPKVTTYDLEPEMSAKEITDNLINELDNFDLIIVNYANGDMVGHTGKLNAAIQSLEYLDKCIKKVYEKVEEKNGLMLITADHGNCDEMIGKQGQALTTHSLNKVMFIVTDKKYKVQDGKLSDIAPSLLSISGYEVPKEMTGDIIIKKRY